MRASALTARAAGCPRPVTTTETLLACSCRRKISALSWSHITGAIPTLAISPSAIVFDKIKSQHL
jgi:hypothetical protein